MSRKFVVFQSVERDGQRTTVRAEASGSSEKARVAEAQAVTAVRREVYAQGWSTRGEAVTREIDN